MSSARTSCVLRNRYAADPPSRPPTQRIAAQSYRRSPSKAPPFLSLISTNQRPFTRAITALLSRVGAPCSPPILPVLISPVSSLSAHSAPLHSSASFTLRSALSPISSAYQFRSFCPPDSVALHGGPVRMGAGRRSHPHLVPSKSHAPPMHMCIHVRTRAGNTQSASVSSSYCNTSISAADDSQSGRQKGIETTLRPDCPFVRSSIRPPARTARRIPRSAYVT